MNKFIHNLLFSAIGICTLNTNEFVCQAMEYDWKDEIEERKIDTLVVGGLRETPANMKSHWIVSGDNCLVVNTDPLCEPDIQANGFDVESLNSKLNSFFKLVLSDRKSFGLLWVKYEHVGYGFVPSKNQPAFEKLCSLLKPGGTFEYSSYWVDFTCDLNQSFAEVRNIEKNLSNILGFQVSSDKEPLRDGDGLDLAIHTHFSALTTPFLVDYEGLHNKYFLPDSNLHQYVCSFKDLNLKNIEVMIDKVMNFYSFTIRGTV